ncbi:histidine kinase [Selenomonas sputigena]|uniref:Histidine kinase n=1 Tax=Selenomonas sputigena TaxID=69823 RepID=A0ABV3X805_9FIRM
MKRLFFSPIKFSLKYLFCYAFVLLFIFPVACIQIVSYLSNIQIVNHIMQDAANRHLYQMQQNLQIALSSYDYMLYQLYTDKKLMHWLEADEERADAARARLEITQLLRTAIHGQSYVQVITIVTEDGQVFLFDRLKGSQEKHNWLNDSSMPLSYIYQQVVEHRRTYAFSTTSGKDFSGQIYHYFHIAHAIRGGKNGAPVGIVILSLDADVLNKECNADLAYPLQQEQRSFCFILDRSDNIVSFPDPALIGHNIPCTERQNLAEACRTFLYTNGVFRENGLDVQILHDDRFGWNLVRVSDEHDLISYIDRQYQIAVLGMLLVAILLGSMVFFLNRKVIHSLNQLLQDMRFSDDDVLVMPLRQRSFIREIDGLHAKFYHMLHKINALIERIKIMTLQQKDAEIRVLEAQINPHFLYNSLDMINWMAIDAEEYGISDAVHLLAQILRYAITGINQPTQLVQEIDWMKKYLHLLQMKAKGSFQYRIELESGLEECLIYKMLLQPFMENAILHGFSRTGRAARLEIYMHRRGARIEIIIIDNGVGISQDKLNKIQQMIQDLKNPDVHHIGIYNVCNRLHLYYGKEAELKISSVVGQGTKVSLAIPQIQEGGQ